MKKLLLSSLLILPVGLVIGFLFYLAPPLVHEDPLVTQTLATTNLSVSDKSIVEKSLVEAHGSIEGVASKKQSFEQEHWRETRGYFRTDEQGKPVTAYDSFENEQLEILVAQGDPIAMQLLGDRKLFEGDASIATALYTDASVYGFSNSIVKLATVSLQKAHSSENAEEKIQHALQAFSYLELALLRGDSSAQLLIQNHNFQFSDEQKNQISEMAMRHYEQLQRFRNQLGLGEFDNSSPF